MAKNKRTFDVFVTYDQRDHAHATSIADLLDSYGLTVYLGTEAIASGKQLESVIWEAMADSHALIVVIPHGSLSSYMSFEIGAAKAWNKIIYAVSTEPNSTTKIPMLHDVATLPLERLDDIARSILSSREPLTEEERQYLSKAYQKVGIPADQVATRPQALAKLVNEFNRLSGKELSGEQLVWFLLRLRKSGGLPKLVPPK